VLVRGGARPARPLNEHLASIKGYSQAGPGTRSSPGVPLWTSAAQGRSREVSACFGPALCHTFRRDAGVVRGRGFGGSLWPWMLHIGLSIRGPAGRHGRPLSRGHVAEHRGALLRLGGPARSARGGHSGASAGPRPGTLKLIADRLGLTPTRVGQRRDGR
jgi:hypothetical protein